MRTEKEISFITWSDVLFVRKKSDELVQKGILSYYHFIEHLPESDETKKHIHWFAVPDGKIDTKMLIEHFTEIDSAHPGKPIRPADVHKSKFLDSYLYFLHDPDYLASKGEAREYMYQQTDFITSSFDVMHEMYLRADKSKIKGNGSLKIKEAIENNVSFVDLLASGSVPIQLINQYRTAYELMGAKVYRNGRPGHDFAPADFDKGISLEEFLYTKYGIDLTKEIPDWVHK